MGTVPLPVAPPPAGAQLPQLGPSAATLASMPTYSVTFGAGPLGLSVEAAGAFSVVSRVSPGGAADKGGVTLRSLVRAVNGEQVSDLDTVCRRISSSPRPVTIVFQRV